MHSNNDPSIPSCWQYVHKILLMARHDEQGKWLWSALKMLFGIAVSVLSGTAVGATVQSQAGESAGIISGTIVGLFGLLSCGIWGFFKYFVLNAYKTHCEQIGQFNSFKKSSMEAYYRTVHERDNAIRQLDTKPITLFEAKAFLKKAAAWLLSESCLEHKDIESHRQKIQSLCEQLCGCEAPTGRIEPITIDGERHAKPPPQSTGTTLEKMSYDLDYIATTLSQGHFNETWKPPEWLLSQPPQS